MLTICAYPVKQQLMARGVPLLKLAWQTSCPSKPCSGHFVASLWISGVQLSWVLPQITPQVAEFHADLRVFLHNTFGIADNQVRAIADSIDLCVLLNTASNLLGGVMSIGSGGLFLLLLVIFMGIDANYFPTILAVVKEKRAPVVVALSNLAKLSRSFMIMTTIFGAIVAVLHFILLLALGALGALGAIMALLAGGLPTFIAVVAFYGVTNSLIQSVIQSKFVSGSVNLNMTLTFLSAIFMSALLGPLDALMAVPLTLFVRAVLVDAHPQATKGPKTGPRLNLPLVRERCEKTRHWCDTVGGGRLLQVGGQPGRAVPELLPPGPLDPIMEFKLAAVGPVPVLHFAHLCHEGGTVDQYRYLHVQ